MAEEASRISLGLQQVDVRPVQELPSALESAQKILANMILKDGESFQSNCEDVTYGIKIHRGAFHGSRVPPRKIRLYVAPSFRTRLDDKGNVKYRQDGGPELENALGVTVVFSFSPEKRGDPLIEYNLRIDTDTGAIRGQVPAFVKGKRQLVEFDYTNTELFFPDLLHVIDWGFKEASYVFHRVRRAAVYDRNRALQRRQEREAARASSEGAQDSDGSGSNSDSSALSH